MKFCVNGGKYFSIRMKNDSSIISSLEKNENTKSDKIVNVCDIEVKSRKGRHCIVCWPKIYAPMSRFLELIIENIFLIVEHFGERFDIA